MAYHHENCVDRIWSPMIVAVAGILFSIPAAALIAFGVVALAG